MALRQILAEIDDLSRRISKTVHYQQFVLDQASKAKLLRRFPPKFSQSIAHHITEHFDVPADSGTPNKPHTVKVVGYASDEYLECVVCEVDGKLKAPDGRTYHVTLSLDPSHRESNDSNKVIAQGWERVTPFSLDVHPEKAQYDT